MKPTRLDYCQYLLVSQINYTLTNFADHTENMSHDALNRYLKKERLSGRLVWENVRGDIVQSESGYLVFDDSVADKDFSLKIELVRRQYSGNAHGLIKGIGIVNGVYVNPEMEQFWIIDYRIYDPDGDGKSKLDHVREMLDNVVRHKCLPFRAVLMDTWYATKDLMLYIESLHRGYYCPLKNNRQVDDSTNDLSQDSASGTQEVYGWRWKVEQFHREAKQLTGFEHCQCRKARIQRNHIACAYLVWVRLANVARKTGQTLYRLKHGLLDEYLC